LMPLTEPDACSLPEFKSRLHLKADSSK
jgi:hypothetical protein